MNFYQLYNLLNEYGQTLIQTLIEKFQQEVPTLTPTIIKNYIDRFDRIKNNLPEKDITKYSWRDLENVVDSHQTKNKIKAGKLDPTATDANLLYNQDGLRIYLGKDKKSCVKYGNGYTFCISARGENNMYNHYRVREKGTPYFIFNDNLPKEDDRHLMVLFVYAPPNNWSGNRYQRYSVTLATNKGEKTYDKLDKIIDLYPWVKPIEKFVDDGNKGTVSVETFEILEDWLKASNDNKTSNLYYYFRFYDQFIVDALYNSHYSMDAMVFMKNYNKLQDLLEDENKNLIIVMVKKLGGIPNFNYKIDDYKNLDELKINIIDMIKNENSKQENALIKESLYNFIMKNKEIEEVFNETKNDVVPSRRPDSVLNVLKYDNKYNNFDITLISKPWIKIILKKQDTVHSLAKAHKEYFSNLNWLKQRTPEQLEIILKTIKQKDPDGTAWAVVDETFDDFKKLF
jgi:hypothetical protein